jgi:hypothetical protein
MIPLKRISSLDDPDQYRYHCNHKQYVNDAAGMKAKEANGPGNDQYHRNGVK